MEDNRQNFPPSDHDLLIRIDTRLEGVEKKMHEMNNNISLRVQKLEDKAEKLDDEKASKTEMRNTFIEHQKTHIEQAKEMAATKQEIILINNWRWKVIGIATGISIVISTFGFLIFDKW